MAKIKVEPSKLRSPSERMDGLVRDLSRLAGAVDSVRGNLRDKIAGRDEIAARLREVSAQISREESATKSMKSGLEQIQTRYQQAEEGNLGGLRAEKASISVGAAGMNENNPVTRDGASLLQVSNENKNQFISDFEKNHPKEAKKFNKFLSSGKNNQITEDDIRNIKYLTYTAEEPFRTIYLNSLSKFKMSDADMNDGAFYRPFFHTLNYTYNGDGEDKSKDCFGNDPRDPYTTFFHECGHAIDDLSDASKWWGSDTEKFTAHSDAMGRDITLREAIEYDVYRNRDNPHSIISLAEEVIASNIPGTGSNGNAENVIAAFQTGNTRSLSNDDLNLYNAVRNQYLSSFTGKSAHYESVSDVYGAVSHNALRNGYGHDDKDYWSKSESYAPAELWAEYFSYNMAGSSENLRYLLEYFPESAKVMDQYAGALNGFSGGGRSF